MVLFCHVTSRVEGEPYPNLLGEKGGNAFPTLSFLDADGRLLTQLAIEQRTVADFQATYDALLRWRELRQKVEAGDASLTKKLFLTELDFGMLGLDEARARLAELDDLDDAERRRVEAQLVEIEFQTILRATTRERASRLDSGEKLLAMLEAERIPRGQQLTSFWMLILEYAEAREDAELFEKVMNRAKKELAGDPRVERYLRSVEARLEKLRGK